MSKLSLAFLFCLMAVPVFGETIKLKSGKIVEGKIVERNEQFIKVDSGIGVNLTYYWDQINQDAGKKPLSQNAVPSLSSLPEDPKVIFEKTLAAYKAMETYQSSGTITAHIQLKGGNESVIKKEFTIVLKKPNLYRITWKQNTASFMNSTGAVWSDGSHPFLYMGPPVNSYSKATNDEMAIAAATGISGGSAHTIPSLFFDFFKQKNDIFSSLRDVQLMGSELVDNEECYVIRGHSRFPKEETYWISKSKYLIKKHSQSLDTPEGESPFPEFSDEQMIESIKAMGQEGNPEQIRQMKDTLKMAREKMKDFKMKGNSVEIHSQITSPELSQKDFIFAVPEGTVLKKSFLDNNFGNSKNDENKKASGDSSRKDSSR